MAKATTAKRAKKTAVKKSTSKKAAVRKSTSRKRAPQKPKDSCFVMMPFSDPFDLYYEKLYKPAIEKAGLNPTRADDLFRPSAIVSDLWKMIQDAKVLFAELTTKNANVFYELGLAHALGKPVILVSETIDDVPFDLQQLRVLTYDKDNPAWGDELMKKIVSSIQETLVDPLGAVPNTFRKKIKSHAPHQDAIDSRLDELESQLRLVRIRQNRDTHLSRTSFSSNDAARELREVNDPDEFERWVRRWKGRIPSRILERMVYETPGIPDEEADRIRKIRSIQQSDLLFETK